MADFDGMRKERGMGNLVHNEQMKSLAAFCVNLGVGGMVVGVLAPLFSPVDGARDWAVVTLPVGAIWAAMMLILAMQTLKKLKE
jgi:hypothetical protein